MPKKHQCLFCSKTVCKARIYTVEGIPYDEISCHDHIRDLERHADTVLSGQPRHHKVSSIRVTRGGV